MSEVATHGGWKQVLPLLQGERRRLIIAFVAVIATTLLQFSIPALTERIVDGLQAGRQDMQPLALAIAGIALLGAAVRASSRTALLDSARGVERNIRRALFRQLTRLSPSYFQRLGIGDLVSRCTGDLVQVRAMISPSLLLLANALVGYAIALPLMIRLNPLLTVVAVVPVVPIVVVLRMNVQRVFGSMRHSQTQLGALSGFVRQNLKGQLTVKSFGRETEEGQAFDRVNEQYFEAQLRLARGQATTAVLLEVAGLVSALAVLGVGARGVMNGSLTLGGYVAFSVYLAELAHRSTLLGFFLVGWQRGRASLARTEEVLAEKPELTDAHPGEKRALRGAIRVSGLSVTRGTRRVLEQIDLTVPAGGTVAIVGSTGSGKSTLLEALATLLPVPRGTLWFDELELGDWPLAHLRQQLGTTPQEAFLFATSWRRNVTLDRAVSEAQLTEAIDAAQLTADLAATPGGLDAAIGERGATLSGGQRSRTGLARALLTKPAILILDDPFASVDPQVAQRMWERLVGDRRRTIVLATHRLALAKNCEQIVVLESGAIVERGSHVELLARAGVYAGLFAREQARPAANGSVQ